MSLRCKILLKLFSSLELKSDLSSVSLRKITLTSLSDNNSLFMLSETMMLA